MSGSLFEQHNFCCCGYKTNKKKKRVRLKKKELGVTFYCHGKIAKMETF